MRDSALKGWLIPVDDLLAAGLRLHAPSPPDGAAALHGAEGRPVDEANDVAGLQAELERMRHEHALAKADAERARLLAQVDAQHRREQRQRGASTSRTSSRHWPR